MILYTSLQIQDDITRNMLEFIMDSYIRSLTPFPLSIYLAIIFLDEMISHFNKKG